MTICENPEIPLLEHHSRSWCGNVMQLYCAMLMAILFLAPVPAAHAAELHEAFNAHQKHGKDSIDHSAWGELLDKHLQAGEDGLNRFDYASLKKSGIAGLQRYLDTLKGTDPATLTIAEQFAFWTNLYNAKTVEIVALHYPVASIRDIKLSLNPFAGPWQAKVMSVKGHELSLDDIEHKILRPVWKDPRIHYVANCASVGCPNLALVPYTGETLETMLEDASRAYINSPRGVRLDGSRLVVSSLYDWYADDFGRTTPEILAHIAGYTDAALAKRLKEANDIDDYAYDWMLNDRK